MNRDAAYALPAKETEGALTEWADTADVGANIRYHVGTPFDGHQIKRVAGRFAMKGLLFLFQVRTGVADQSVYCARKLSTQAGKILKMGEYRT